MIRFKRALERISLTIFCQTMTKLPQNQCLGPLCTDGTLGPGVVIWVKMTPQKILHVDFFYKLTHPRTQKSQIWQVFTSSGHLSDHWNS